MGGMVSQNILNLVDTAMVGSLGKAALAAVGLGGFVNFMFQAFLTGLSTGVQAMASRRKGEDRAEVCALPLNGVLLLAAAIGIPWSILIILLVPYFYPYLNDDPEVIRIGVPYLQVRLVGMVAIAMNFSFRGFWNGIGKSTVYLFTLVVMHLFNAGVSYVLIFGLFGAPELGATGAGLGTTASVFLGTAIYLVMGLKIAKPFGFLQGLPDKETIARMWKLSLPTGLQQTFFAAGYVALFWIISQVGTTEMAAANVLMNVSLVAVLPGIGLGIAAATFVGQALGRNAPAEAQQWGWDVAGVAVVVLGLLGAPMAIVPEQVLGVFIHEPGPIAVAVLPLRIIGLTIWIDGVGMVLFNAMMGAGETKLPAIVTTSMQWIVFLPAAFIVGPTLGYGLIGIWIAQISYRFVQTLIFVALWKAGKWTSATV